MRSRPALPGRPHGSDGRAPPKIDRSQQRHRIRASLTASQIRARRDRNLHCLTGLGDTKGDMSARQPLAGTPGKKGARALAPHAQSGRGETSTRTLGSRPERQSRWRGPRCLVADASGRSARRLCVGRAGAQRAAGIERHLAWHDAVLEFPLAAILDAAHAAGAKHNDAFVSAITAGLRLYHGRHDTEVDELRVTMPVSIRKADDPIGSNRITLMRFKVPLGIADPSERMAETHRRCESVKTDRSLPFTNAIAGTLNMLPRASIGGMPKHIDFLASNVPGIDVPLYLTCAKVERFYGFGPTIGASLNVTLMSYCGTCCVGVNVDTGAVPDADVMMDCLKHGFDEVLAVGGGTAHAVSPPTARGAQRA